MEMNVLHRHGWTVSQLAREFGISRTTVYKELASEMPRRYAERAKPTALNEAQATHVERRLTVCPGIRATILYDELRRDYRYEGSYVTFARHMRCGWPTPLPRPRCAGGAPPTAVGLRPPATATCPPPPRNRRR
jgi:Helix-turn-helix domain of resolvase